MSIPEHEALPFAIRLQPTGVLSVPLKLITCLYAVGCKIDQDAGHHTSINLRTPVLRPEPSTSTFSRRPTYG